VTAPDDLSNVAEAAREERTRMDRIYRQRERDVPAGRYSVFDRGALAMHQQRERAVLEALTAAGITDLQDTRILDVGCGKGEWFVEFLRWGASPRHLFGVDLSLPRCIDAGRRIGCRHLSHLAVGPRLLVADGVSLPWRRESFDLVVLSTVLSSVASQVVRQAIAREVLHVVRPGGHVLLYDFLVGSPSNREVRGLRKAEILRLFSCCDVRLWRRTLAPPLARTVGRVSPVMAHLLEGLRVFNLHYVGLVRRPR
jgi:ubiquinone/menaquinone biosynthesis C-methylase UbiE